MMKNNDKDTKVRLFEAATALFAERGYAGTFVREIAERAEVTKPVLYYYFKNKEGIFRTILDWATEKQEEILAEVLERGGSVHERLIFLYRSIYQTVKEYEDVYKMIHNLLFGPRHGAPDCEVERYHMRLVDAVKTIYQEGVARDEVLEADPDDVAYLCVSLIDFCLYLEFVRPDLSDPVRPERLLLLAFQGLGQRKILEGARIHG